MRHLGGIDTVFVRAETPTMHLHVCGVLMLDTTTMRGGVERARVRQLVADRLPLLAPFRWRLIEPPGGVGGPRWIEDPDFDLDRHIRMDTLPKPGSRADLERYVATVAGTPLRRDRPLWEMHLLDGLDDGHTAVVTKLHHAFMDGGAGAEIMASLFDLTPEVDTPAPGDDWEPEPVPSTARLLRDAGFAALGRVGRIPRAVVETATGLTGMAGAMFPSPDGSPLGGVAPRSPFNGPLTPDRTVALGTCSLTDVKRVKDGFGVTVNDVVLAAVATSLRRELLALGAAPDRPLVAAVPISVRTTDAAGGFGNHTSAMMVPLPTHIDDPIERLRAVHELAVQTKEQHQSMGTGLLETWAALWPPWAISAGSQVVRRAGAAGLVPPVFNLIVSNVQGPPISLYLAGAEVTGAYPLGPLMEGCGLNITVMSQGDALNIGLIADPSLVEHPHELTDGLAVGIDELLALLPRSTRRKAARAGERRPT